ncbi:MAG TPA: lysophospholipid acyltransferase family protein [Usitatibacter sp.]|nr:lysophospholipid acyltransferase family protein [Usitatibacter sp.]
MSPPLVGASIPRRNSAPLRAFGRLVLRTMGWRMEGEIPDAPKLVVAVAPHTSNWDFIIGMGTMFALDLDLSFLGKHTLFRGPMGAVMRWMGGIAVNRASSHGVVGDAVAAFERSNQRLLAIAPQGTRSAGARYRSGFLHIARGARVPVLLATLDYGARCVRFGPVFDVGQDIDADLRRVESFFAPVRGKNMREAVLVPPRTKA